MFYRVLLAGYRIIYEPRATIHHNHRQSLGEVLRAAYNSGASERSFSSKYSRRHAYGRFWSLGAFFYHISALTGVCLRFNHELLRLEYERLRGFIIA